MTGYIYAIDAGELVKIGWSREPSRRFTKVRSDNPFAKRVIGWLPASADDESELHERLSPHRVRNEWYRREGLVCEFINTLPPLPSKEKTHGKNRPGNLIRTRRFALGLTTTQVAEAIGLSQATVSRVERGNMDPSIETLRRLCRFFGGTPTVGEMAEEFANTVSEERLKASKARAA